MDKKTKPKNKGGRPKEDVADKVDFEQVEKIAGLGMTDVEIGYILGVTERTVNNWKKDERFLSALKRGKAIANAQLVETFFKRANGYTVEEVTYEAIKYGNGTVTKNQKVKTVVKHIEPNPTCLIFGLKNRMPDRYREIRPDTEATKPPTDDKTASIDKLIQDAEARVQRAENTCH